MANVKGDWDVSKESYVHKYYFYEGTETIEELEEHLTFLKLSKSKCYFVKFLNQYYAVFYDTIDREIIIGKEKMFYTDNGRLEEVVVGAVKIPYDIKTRSVGYITDTLAQELNRIDPELQLFYYPNVRSKHLKEASDEVKFSKFVVILAVTFASKFYNVTNSNEMYPYFKLTSELIGFLRRTAGAVAIDPFSQYIKFQDGSLGKYSITFYADSYYSRRATFVLTERNPYRQQGRQWISLTRYQALYPGDFIMYPKPDYRVEKETCKWCGIKISEGEKHYCTDSCKYNFLKATTIDKGSSLPYKILCRDNFTCQKCYKDLAMINEHGMKIPISKKADSPDKNGRYRSEAEVHHLTAVEDGGEDFQENLSTRCQSCHKREHASRTPKEKTNVIPFRPRKKTRF